MPKLDKKNGKIINYCSKEIKFDGIITVLFVYERNGLVNGLEMD